MSSAETVVTFRLYTSFSALERPFTLKCYHMSGWLNTELKMAYKNNLIDFLLHWVLGVLGLVMISLKGVKYNQSIIKACSAALSIFWGEIHSQL